MPFQKWQQVANTQQKLVFLLALVFLTVVFFRVFYRPRQVLSNLEKGRLQGLKLEKDSLKKVSEIPIHLPPGTSNDIKLKVLHGDVEPLRIRTMPDLLKEATAPQFLRGLEVISVHDKPSKKEEGYELFSTVLMMRGSFFSISSFIERIEQLPLLVKVSDLSMKMISQENPGIQTELTLEFYQMKDGLL